MGGMKAEQMFKEYGCTKEEYEDLLIFINEEHDSIVFNLTRKYYFAHTHQIPRQISVQEHKAIHQQLIELGWTE